MRSARTGAVEWSGTAWSPVGSGGPNGVAILDVVAYDPDGRRIRDSLAMTTLTEARRSRRAGHASAGSGTTTARQAVHKTKRPRQARTYRGRCTFYCGSHYQGRA